jgi:hypothetical protein
MTPDEIEAKEHELEARAKELDAREASLTQQLTAATTTGSAPPNPNLNTIIANPNPPHVAANPNPNLPNPNTYATSIKLHIPITLSLDDGNYTSWRELFLVSLSRYGLITHVLGESTPSDIGLNSYRGRDDYIALSWLYGSVFVALLNIVMTTGATARLIWDAIENLFHDNKKHRAIQLEADFRNTPQGTSPSATTAPS